MGWPLHSCAGDMFLRSFEPSSDGAVERHDQARTPFERRAAQWVQRN